MIRRGGGLSFVNPLTSNGRDARTDIYAIIIPSKINLENKGFAIPFFSAVVEEEIYEGGLLLGVFLSSSCLVGVWCGG